MSLAPFNLTIPDQSPTFRYSPYSDGDINGGWNVTYTGISDSSYVVHTSQSIGQGISTHRTSFVGASASIEWTGTAVYLIGSSQGGGSAYTTSVDDSTALPGQPNSDQHLLASYTGLNYGDHTLTLDVVEPSLINLSAAIITVGIGAPGLTVQNQTYNAVNLSGSSSTLNQYFTETGSWKIATGDVGGNPVYPNVQTSNQGDQISFKVSNASAFILEGNSYIDHGLYNVTFTDPSGAQPPVPQQFNGSSRWESENCILYYKTGLDASKEYSVQLQNVDSSGHFMDFIGMTTMTTSSGATSTTQSGISSSIIAGIVIGALAAVFGITGIIFLYLRHLRRYGGTRPGPDFTIDPEKLVAAPNRDSVSDSLSTIINPFAAVSEIDPRPNSTSVYPAGGRRSRSGSSETSSTISGGSTILHQEADAGPIEALPPIYDPSWGRSGNHTNGGVDMSSRDIKRPLN